MTAASHRQFRAALVQLRSGRAVAPSLDAAEDLIRRAAAQGADYVQTPENTAIMELETERLLAAIDVEERAAPLARLKALARELGILAPCRLARHEVAVGQDRQPLLCHWPRRRGGRALRQAASVRCRPCGRRELSRIAELRSWRQGGGRRPALGAARSHHLLRSSLPCALPRACAWPVPSSSPCLRPSPGRPGRRIGMCCSVPAPSRPGPSFSPPTRAGCTRMAAAPMGTA